MTLRRWIIQYTARNASCNCSVSWTLGHYQSIQPADWDGLSCGVASWRREGRTHSEGWSHESGWGRNFPARIMAQHVGLN